MNNIIIDKLQSMQNEISIDIVNKKSYLEHQKRDLPAWIKKRYIADCEVLGEWSMSDKDIKKAKQKAQRDLIGFMLVPVFRQELAK